MMSYLTKVRLGVFVALALISQAGFSAEEHGGGNAADVIKRYKDSFPEINTVISRFNDWADKENKGLISKLDSEEHKKQAEWATRVLWLRGSLGERCKTTDKSVEHLTWMIDYCFGNVSKDGRKLNRSAVHRLVVDGMKEDDKDEAGLAMLEIQACREGFQNISKWMDNKVKTDTAFEAEKKVFGQIDKFFGVLEDKLETPDSDEAKESVKGSLAKIKKHTTDFQSALKETTTENLCRLGVNTNGPSGANGPTPTVSATPSPSPTSSPAANGAVWKDKYGNICTPPAAGCEKVSGGNQSAAYAPPGGLTSNVVPPSAPIAPIPSSYGNGLGAGGYGGCGIMGCDYGGGYGGGGRPYIPPPAGANPGSLPPPPTPFIGPGGGFGFSYAQGPKYPPPPPLPPPPLPYPPPPPPMPPLMFAQGAAPQGGSMPTVETVTTTTTVAKTTPSSSSSNSMPMPMPYGFMNRCNKPVCPPMFGAMAFANQFPMMNPYAMGLPPTNGFIPRQIPPSVTPYYPGTTPGSYGPITTTPVITTTTPTSPYVNPTFYGTPQQQYSPIPSTRDRIGRTV